MSLFERRMALFTVVAALCVPAAAAPGNKSAALIVGKWRHVSLHVVEDGKARPLMPATTEVIGEYRADGTWTLDGTKGRNAGTYRWLDENRVEQRIVESNIAHQPGMVSVKQVKVDKTRLEIVTVNRRAEMDKISPPKDPTKKWPEVTVVTSVFSRVTPQ